jgi:type IV secretory pathway VirB10-like protein
MLKDKNGKPLTRSEGEAVMKGRTSITVSIFAALLAINALISNGNSGKILNNTIAANDTYAFYQAKSIKQVIAEQNRDDAAETLELQGGEMSQQSAARLRAKITAAQAQIERYESDPRSNEGKRELLAKAKKLEAERDAAKQRSPWFGMAAAFLQIGLVLSSTAILGVSMALLWGSIGFGTLGTLMMVVGWFSWVTWPF